MNAIIQEITNNEMKVPYIDLCNLQLEAEHIDYIHFDNFANQYIAEKISESLARLEGFQKSEAEIVS